MPDPLQISRLIRRRVRRPGLAIDVAADVNVAVATGGRASARQRTVLRQERPAPGAADRKEQP